MRYIITRIQKGKYFQRGRILLKVLKRNKKKIQCFTDHKNMISTSTERLRRKIQYRESSVPINKIKNSSREIEEKLRTNESDFLIVTEHK